MPILVAEVKTMSPFGFRSPYSWDELFEHACLVGDVISVHTDPRWGGALADIKRAAARTAKPILAKGLHVTDDEVKAALDCGASWALVVGRVPPANLRLYTWHEPLDLADVQRDLPYVVWNQRDLTTGLPKTETFAQARAARGKGWLCQASMIRSSADVHPGANAILVGEHLLDYPIKQERRPR